MAAAETVAPRQPIDEDRIDRGLRPRLRDHRLVRREHQIGRQHPLRRSRRARREEHFGNRAGIDACERRVGPRDVSAVQFNDAGEHRQRRTARANARRDAVITGIDQRGIQHVEQRAQSLRIGVAARVAGRERRDRHAAIHRGVRDDRMIDAVIGEHRNGPLRRRAEREDPRCGRAHAQQGVAVCQRAPTGAVAFGDERCVRPFGRPAHEIVEDAFGNEGQRCVRCEDDRRECVRHTGGGTAARNPARLSSTERPAVGTSTSARR